MNTNEIVRALTDAYSETDPVYFFLRTLLKEAANEIGRLQKELDAAVKDIRAVLHDEADCCQICKFDGQCKPDIICHCSEAEWRGRESEVK